MKDESFIRGDKVPMTKEEIRAISLNKLNIHTGNKLMDIGAGSGSVSIEACMINQGLQVTAIESREAACEIIKANKEKFHIKDTYKIIQGVAPMDIEEKYDRIFIGGSRNALEKIITWSYDILEEDGILVANFIVYENAIQGKKFLQQVGFTCVEMCQVMVNHAKKIGNYEYLKPINPVFIIKAEKVKRDE